jgi:hypothetical protein
MPGFSHEFGEIQCSRGIEHNPRTFPASLNPDFIALERFIVSERMKKAKGPAGNLVLRFFWREHHDPRSGP